MGLCCLVGKLWAPLLVKTILPPLETTAESGLKVDLLTNGERRVKSSGTDFSVYSRSNVPSQEYTFMVSSLVMPCVCVRVCM